MKLVQTDCPKNKFGICTVASKLADRPINIYNEEICLRCKEQSNPQNVNLVTVDLSVIKLYNNGQQYDSYELRSKYIQFYIGDGPGFQLIRIFKYIGIDINDDRCKCEAIALAMNRSGSSGCREKVDKIIDRIRSNAEKRGFGWYSDTVAKTLIFAACDLADGKSWEQVLSENKIIGQAKIIFGS